MLEYLKNKKILIVAAHPDDEVLGMGASISRFVNELSCTVKVVILGEGLTSRTDGSSHDLTKHRESILTAKKVLGYQHLSVHNLPDNAFDSIKLLEVIRIIEEEKKSFDADVIFTHFWGDLNIDHQISFKAVLTAFRPLSGTKPVSLYCFEVPSSTETQAPALQEFSPNFYFKVSRENISAKQRAMECYEFEKREFPHPRSSRALEIISHRWGINVGHEYCEPFILVRTVTS